MFKCFFFHSPNNSVFTRKQGQMDAVCVCVCVCVCVHACVCACVSKRKETM